MGKQSSAEGGRKYQDLTNENDRLKRENVRLQMQPKRAEGLIELQKKVSEILWVDLPDPEKPG